jgi:Antirestriction protein
VLLGDRLEIGSDACNHAAYLAGWLHLLQQSPKVLLRVLGDARRAADLICPEAAEPNRPGPEQGHLPRLLGDEAVTEPLVPAEAEVPSPATRN